jgi:DNA repair exonuclease SbcCD ATPase subunit
MVEARRQQQARKERGVEERLRRAEQAVARRKEQAAQARTATALAAGATVLGGLLGGRWGGKAARTIQWAARAKDAESEVKRAEENAAACREELRALQGAHARELEELRARYQPGQAHLEVVELRPARGRIEVVALALGWLEGVGAGG